MARGEVARLVGRTEPWVAALYLALVSLRNHPQPEDFAERFAGTSRYVGTFSAQSTRATADVTHGVVASPSTAPCHPGRRVRVLDWAVSRFGPVVTRVPNRRAPVAL
jgi:hypothetical protein